MEPHLATPDRSPLAQRARAAGITVIPVESRGDLDLLAAARIRRVLSGVDVLHLHTGHAHAIGILATVGLRSRPAVVVSRRVDFPIKGGIPGRLKYGSRVDRFLTVSRFVSQVLVEGGVDPERVMAVHSGIDPSRFEIPRDRDGLLQELGVPGSVKLVGFVGALVGHKAPMDLLEALATLPETVHGVVVGAGGLEAELKRRAETDDLKGRVHFLGHRDDVPRILRSIDVFCLPSRQEGLGTSVLDAMASATPVVAAAGGGIPEMVEDGQSGILVPADDPSSLGRKISEVLSDADLALQLAEGGRKRVRVFTAARMVERTLEVYEGVLAERRRPAGPSLPDR
jgi:glycosyltransferase involved in cell wall biosynthesis